MTKREMKKFEKILISERDRLTQGLHNLEADTLYRPASDNHGDLDDCADVGTDSFERETALRMAGEESNWLMAVNEALRRINEGRYGQCEGCEGEIPKKRLEAFPAAVYCVECQSKLERDGFV
jgi:DnaK suppressor protein